MWVKLLSIKGSWQDVKDAAMSTIGKDEGKNPSSKWKKQILLAEHSPIRKLHINWKWYDIRYWVSVHFVRHKYGIEHWVATEREDRNMLIQDRDAIRQGNLITHEAEANCQSIINISRKRLCKMASPETREAWIRFLDSFEEIIPELHDACVPECIYRGYCFEFNSCGYFKTPAYIDALGRYREGINEKIGR